MVKYLKCDHTYYNMKYIVKVIKNQSHRGNSFYVITFKNGNVEDTGNNTISIVSAEDIFTESE